jgi:hypothetical protein
MGGAFLPQDRQVSYTTHAIFCLERFLLDNVHFFKVGTLYLVKKVAHSWSVSLSRKKTKSAHPSCPQAGTAHRPQTLWLAVCCVLCAVLWLWACACALSVLCAGAPVCCVLAVCCVLDAAGRADLLLGSAGQTDLARTPSLQYEALARPLHGRRGRCRAAHPPQGTEHERSASPHPASRARAPPFVLRSHAESSS